MDFPGWTADDFAIFDVDGFEGRMALIREHIQPKLDALGRDLAPLLEAETGTAWFHHVAKHMRRTVNAPDDTWVALNRVKRGYKATVHFDAGISARGANVCLVVKPECRERIFFAAALEGGVDEWRALYQEAEGLYLGDVPNAPLLDLLPAREALTDDWMTQAEALRRKKQFEFEMGYRFDSATAVISGPDFVHETLRRIRSLLPLYLAGLEPGLETTLAG